MKNDQRRERNTGGRITVTLWITLRQITTDLPELCCQLPSTQFRSKNELFTIAQH